MQVDELLPFLKENQEILSQEIRSGNYKPNPVRRVEIPKETKGEFRKLGVPTVVDRVIQQAIAQELSPIFEEQFSENSFGFRPKRGAHDALGQCQKNVNDGYVYVVDMDLEKFFDTVCQSKLIEVNDYIMDWFSPDQGTVIPSEQWNFPEYIEYQTTLREAIENSSYMNPVDWWLQAFVEINYSMFVGGKNENMVRLVNCYW